MASRLRQLIKDQKLFRLVVLVVLEREQTQLPQHPTTVGMWKHSERTRELALSQATSSGPSEVWRDRQKNYSLQLLLQEIQTISLNQPAQGVCRGRCVGRAS